MPKLEFAEFLKLAARLGCVGVELRNDLGRPFFDGVSPEDAGQLVADAGLRVLGLSQIYPFNDWTAERIAETRALIEVADAVGAETFSLIPRNDGLPGGDLTGALRDILAMLEGCGLTALVEPLGFGRSSLRTKAAAAEAIRGVGGQGRIKLVHDTFHHALAGETEIFAAQTGIVHISGVVDTTLALDAMEDDHRVLVDAKDRLGNVTQIQDLHAAGYSGVISLECFAPSVQMMQDPYSNIKRTFDYISSQVMAECA